MKFITRLVPVIAVVALAPALALAQGSADLGEISDTFGLITSFINDTLVPLVFAIAFLVFIWGVFKYFIAGGGDESSRDSGKQLMLWGIIAFVLMVSIWGIVNIISGGLGIESETLDNIPKATGVGS